MHDKANTAFGCHAGTQSCGALGYGTTKQEKQGLDKTLVITNYARPRKAYTHTAAEQRAAVPTTTTTINDNILLTVHKRAEDRSIRKEAASDTRSRVKHRQLTQAVRHFELLRMSASLPVALSLSLTWLSSWSSS